MTVELMRAPDGSIQRADEVMARAQRQPNWPLIRGIQGVAPLPEGWEWVELKEKTEIAWDHMEGLS